MKEDDSADGLFSVLFDETADARAGIPPAELTEKIIGCAYIVSNTLGCGFIERVYENSLAYELRKASLSAVQQRKIAVKYEGVVVGDYEADIIVEDCVIIEIKATRALNDAHRAQCLNYLKATGIRVGLVINFGTPKVEIRRVIH